MDHALGTGYSQAELDSIGHHGPGGRYRRQWLASLPVAAYKITLADGSAQVVAVRPDETLLGALLDATGAGGERGGGVRGVRSVELLGAVPS